MKPVELTLAILSVLKTRSKKQQSLVGKQNRTNQSSGLSKDQDGRGKTSFLETTTSTLH